MNPLPAKTMTETQQKRIIEDQLAVNPDLHNFIQQELLPDSDISADHFWKTLQNIVSEFGPRNQEMLRKRDELQAQIDQWHSANFENFSTDTYKSFLKNIGYLEEEVNDFAISTENVDPEVASIPGAQLVVPVDNARYALNAANARWGSFYDSLYGTDAISKANGCNKTRRYNPIRGDKIIDYTRDFLDQHFALEQGTHHWAINYQVVDGALIVTLGDGLKTPLLQPERFVGFLGEGSAPDAIVLEKNKLHTEIRFGEGFFIGRRDHANIYDMQLESALTTIMDLEDSVASVDADDKIQGYRNWLGLMQGDLVESFTKGDETVKRELNADRIYTAPNGGELRLKGRSLMLVRNVGTHLATDGVLHNGNPIAETMLDILVTAIAGKKGLSDNTQLKNSATGSVYIVKPKMHGSEEVRQAVELFASVEDAIGLPRNTLKMGIMDEERRTSCNLKNCVYEARERVFFINTGFLDRTGDEIHTDMEAGPVLPKSEMKGASWLQAYENRNVDTGLGCGFSYKAQIGKGMWAMPDEMDAMLRTKITHPNSGANTAWVPSPTAATLHATHYFTLDVMERQKQLMGRKKSPVDTLLEIPLMEKGRVLPDRLINQELENNCQGILGYVVRWVGQGVGCSKVPDINNIDLMEDCATLRISSQHLANWIHHGILNEQQVEKAMERMAVVVDRQNSNDPDYQPMGGNFATSIPFKAALDLALKGRTQANGYTEFILYARRQEMKAST